MWGFLNCTRYYRSAGEPNVVLNNANLVVATDEKLGLLVPPGEGKTTIIRLLAGVEEPDIGTVLRDEGGWPLGYGGAFRPELTGVENARNIGLLAGLDPQEFTAFCADFSELGEAFHHPVASYTGGMRAQLAFAASFGVPARTYLVDAKYSAGDEHFRAKCEAAMRDRLRTTGLIFVASQPKMTKEICERHAILSRGRIIPCASHEEAESLFMASFERAGSDDLGDEALPSFDLA